MYKLLLIALGGALGSVLRYLVGGWIQRGASSRETVGTFPVGTLAVNVSGCFVIGVLAVVLFGDRWLVRPEYRDAILIGVLGGYTTFSSFGLETFAKANEHHWGAAALNIVLSNGLGLLAVWLGYRLAQRLAGT